MPKAKIVWQLLETRIISSFCEFGVEFGWSFDKTTKHKVSGRNIEGDETYV